MKIEWKISALVRPKDGEDVLCYSGGKFFTGKVKDGVIYVDGVKVDVEYWMYVKEMRETLPIGCLKRITIKDIKSLCSSCRFDYYCDRVKDKYTRCKDYMVVDDGKKSEDYAK